MLSSSSTSQLDQLLKIAVENNVDNDEYIVVAQDVPENKFLEFVQLDTAGILDYEHGTVRIRRVPTFQHERAATATFGQIQRSLTKAGVADVFAICDNIGTTSMRIRAGVNKQPDAGFVPRGRMYPTVLIEVGWIESMEELRKDAEAWLTSDLEVTSVILIYIEKNFNPHLGRRLEMEIWENDIGTGQYKPKLRNSQPFGENVDLTKAKDVVIPFTILFCDSKRPDNLDVTNGRCIFDLDELRLKILEAISYQESKDPVLK